MLTLSSKPLVEKLKAELRERAERFRKRARRPAKLVVVLVGEDPASQIYVGQKGKMAEELGLAGDTLRFPASVAPSRVKAAVAKLNRDKKVDGILIQRPLPKAFREEEVIAWIDPAKDVDCFHPVNVGLLQLGLPGLRPCTPAGVMELLTHFGIGVAGKTACVIGRSSIVGKPMATLLLQADATVIHCHSRTPDLARMSAQADLVVAALGKPELIQSRHLKAGAVVVDVGIGRNAEGKLVGDVNFRDASTVASAITPVPGGVGPMTIMMLMRNTLQAAESRR